MVASRGQWRGMRLDRRGILPGPWTVEMRANRHTEKLHQVRHVGRMACLGNDENATAVKPPPPEESERK
jgi:hypothetical protein